MSQVKGKSEDTEELSKPVFDEAFVKQALSQANMNVLRVAMLQITGDQELVDIPVVKSDLRGGALIAYKFSRPEPGMDAHFCE